MAAALLGFLTYPAGAGRHAGIRPVAWKPFRPGKRKPPQGSLRGFWGKALAMTYSRMRMHTTIGAAAFHFRVRNGIGWFHNAMVTRERVEGRGLDGLSRAHALVGLPSAHRARRSVVGG